MVDTPAVGSPDRVIDVHAGDDLLVATFGVVQHVLRMQVALVGGFIAIQLYEMAAHQVLARVQPRQRRCHPVDHSVDASATCSAQDCEHVWGEHVAEVVEVVAVECPAVARRELDHRVFVNRCLEFRIYGCCLLEGRA